MDNKDLNDRAVKFMKSFENGGPAAQRFCSSVQSLLNEIQRCGSNASLGREEIADLEEQLIHLKELNANKKISTAIENEKKAMQDEIEQLDNENKKRQKIIDIGPGWTESQKKQCDELVDSIKREHKTISCSQNSLLDIRKCIRTAEEKIDDADVRRDDLMAEMEMIDEKVNAATEARLARKIEMKEATVIVEALDAQLALSKDELRGNEEQISAHQTDAKKAVKETANIQVAIDRSCREYEECGRDIDLIFNQLDKLDNDNTDLGKEISVKIDDIDLKLEEANDIGKDSKIIEKKKELISKKIIAAESERVEYELKRDNLKLELDNIGKVELKMLNKEYDSHKRNRDRLNREVEVLERERGHSKNSSTIVRDLIASNVTGLKVLQNELIGLVAVGKQAQADIEKTTSFLERECHAAEKASKNRDVAIYQLNKEEATIREAQILMVRAESSLTLKQKDCEVIKTESNAASQKLSKYQESLNQAKKELEETERIISKLKAEIGHSENDLVIEQYNHYRVDEEKDTLNDDLRCTGDNINKIDTEINSNEKNIRELELSVRETQIKRDHFETEFGSLVGDRGVIGSLLVQKNSELESLQDRVRTQQSLLLHGEVQYRDLMTSMADCFARLKHLQLEKNSCLHFSENFDKLVLHTHSLERDIDREKIRNTALREEIDRPFNLHRWRILEHQDPDRFAGIEKVQKLQKQIIVVTGNLAEKDKLVRMNERQYLEMKRMSDHQPLVSEVLEQLDMYQSDLIEKTKQMKEVELEVAVQKGKVDDLNDALSKTNNALRKLALGQDIEDLTILLA